MKVVMTQTASESLWPIYLYHLDYSQDYAEAFKYEIGRFILEHLSRNPLLGHLYHETRGIRREIFQKRHNIYYSLRDDTAWDCPLVFAYLSEARPLPVRRSYRQHSHSRGRKHRTLRGGVRRRRVDSVVGEKRC